MINFKYLVVILASLFFIKATSEPFTKDAVTFWLFTNENPGNPQLLNQSDPGTIQSAVFKTDKPIKILVHGLLGGKDEDINKNIRSEYLKLDYNVISVDYNTAVTTLADYANAGTTVEIVSSCLAEFINQLIQTNDKINTKSIHLLGFSLGAHIAGTAGFLLTHIGVTLARVTALDPANPYFVYQSSLSLWSAEFVDVIHTDANLGSTDYHGHVDFYLNDVTPYAFSDLGHLVSNVFKWVSSLVSEDHMLALEYYAESIRQKQNVKFCGRYLNLTVEMGEYVPYGYASDYSLDEWTADTIEEAPFIPKVPVKIILHGYGGSLKTTPNKELIYEYKKQGYNVLSVDFKSAVSLPCFQQAVINTEIIAFCITRLLSRLLESWTIKLEFIHIIGSDLGGQIAGNVGKMIAQIYGPVPRITAFDPDNPGMGLWYSYLSVACARFVDIIHSYSTKFLGKKSFGHADFYIDNPAVFNKCRLWTAGCPTPAAAGYFAESMKSNTTFCAIPVTHNGQTSYMGEDVDPRAFGVYTVKTNSEYPFAKDCDEV